MLQLNKQCRNPFKLFTEPDQYSVKDTDWKPYYEYGSGTIMFNLLPIQKDPEVDLDMLYC